MSVDIENAIKVSQQAFLQGVWPEIAGAVGGGTIIPVEAVADKKFLDQYSGIDHWHVLKDRSLIRGIASRCQWPLRRMFQSFTIRIGNKAIRQTELAKRLYAMENSEKGWLRPHLFVQAFFGLPHGSFSKFLYAGIAKMDDILTIIRDEKEGERDGLWYIKMTDTKYGQIDNKAFAVIPFSSLGKLNKQFRLVKKATRVPGSCNPLRPTVVCDEKKKADPQMY